jgi:hypothetical protein
MTPAVDRVSLAARTNTGSNRRSGGQKTIGVPLCIPQPRLKGDDVFVCLKGLRDGAAYLFGWATTMVSQGGGRCQYIPLEG